MTKKYELMHHKDFHKIQLQGLKLKERSIFMSLSFRAMNQESNLIEFDVNELVDLINFTQQTQGNIYTYLDETYKSLQKITIQINKKNGFKRFVLFTSFETFEDRGIVQFKVNEDYKYLLNRIAKPYSIQNIFDYNKLASKYSQLTYSLLKEWEGTKKIMLSIDDFKQKLGINNFQMCDIDKRVLSQIMKELPLHFENLKYEKIKSGRKIAFIKFTWQEKSKVQALPENTQEVYKHPEIDYILEEEFNQYCDKYFDNSRIKLSAFRAARAIYAKYRNSQIIIPDEKLNIDVYTFLVDIDKSENQT